MPMIYLDNASTTKLSPAALEAMMPYLTGCCGNPSSIHSFGSDAARAVCDARETVASVLGCDPDEVYFTSGGSEADNTAVRSLCIYARENRFLSVSVSSVEHKAVLRSAEAYSEGLTVEHLNPESPVITGDCGGVSIMLANNETGAVYDVKSAAEAAHSHGALFHTDAVQAVGHIPVNVRKLGVDMLSLSAHKFHGPKGVGALYVKRGTPVFPLIYGGGQESGMRAGTENVAGIVGMATALKESCDRIEADAAAVHGLRTLLCDSLLSAEGIRINSHNNGLPGIVSVTFIGGDAEAMVRSLDLMGIAVSAGAACDTRNVGVSHVLHAMGMSDADAAATVRFSLDASNTEEEIITAANAAKKIYEQIKD